ncbi:hypothetical protein IKI14_05915 [bacterium]|nr:hypothetical protein [bacterium]
MSPQIWAVNDIHGINQGSNAKSTDAATCLISILHFNLSEKNNTKANQAHKIQNIAHEAPAHNEKS